MDVKTFSKQMILFGFLLLILSACSFAQPQATAAPKESSTPVMVEKLASQTAAALPIHTETLMVLPLTMTSTLASTPTQTLTPLAPTQTQTATNTLTPLPTETPLQPPPTVLPWYDCVLVRQSPVNKTWMSPGEDFDMRWTVVNTGSKTWETHEISWYFLNGYALHKYDDVYTMSDNLAPNESMDILVDMIVPTESGSYTAIWALRANDYDFCWFSIEVVVE